MTAVQITPTPVPADLRAALDRIADALAAMFTGDPAPYAALWAPGAQPTLFGAWGPTEKGHDAVVRTFTWVASRFSDGYACRPRHEVVDCSGDLAYTVGFEEVQVRVDGGPPAPMTLRVTHVLRRVGGEWRLVHRHADYPPTDPRR
jgi:ketosteroid isomerase-like protein